MDIKVSDYRKKLQITRSTQDKYLRAIREAYKANGQVFAWKPRAKFIDDQTKAIFELFIKVALIYGFTEGSYKFSQNLGNLESYSPIIERLWITHRPSHIDYSL